MTGIAARPHPPAVARRGAYDMRGFTLVETLVAMVSGLIVMLALFAILDFATRQSSRAGDFAQASQLGRAAMTRLIDELHSTCQSPGETPVLEKSTASELWFENSATESAVIESATRHRVYWVEGEKGGALRESTWQSSGGNIVDGFTYPSTSSTPTSKFLLGEHISRITTGVAKKTEAEEEKVPFFQYYKYKSTAGAVETNKSVSTLEAMTPPAEGLSAKEAKEVSSVLVSFRAFPTDGKTEQGRTADFASQATFSFSSPVSEATITDAPCQ